VVVESKVDHFGSLLCRWFLLNPYYQEAAFFIASDTDHFTRGRQLLLTD